MGERVRTDDQERFRVLVERYLAYISGVRNLSENTVREPSPGVPSPKTWSRP